MATKNQEIDPLTQLVNSVTGVFENFGFIVQKTTRATIWNFTSFNRTKTKKYAIFCTVDMKKVKSLIGVAVKQSQKENLRLVVITGNFDQNDEDDAIMKDYSLVAFDHLREMDRALLDALHREGFSILHKPQEEHQDLGRIIIKGK